MARRHHRRPQPPPARVPGPGTRVEERAGQQWYVRPVTGAAATRAYRCPGCQQAIRPAVPHVVVWPLEPSLQAASAGETGLAERRHWHHGCWGRRR